MQCSVCHQFYDFAYFKIPTNICNDCIGALEKSDEGFNIYVIECEENNYYIGKTTNEVDVRFSQHKNNQNCAFTTKYKPIKIVETFKSKDPLDEDKMTKKYMMKFGIDHVRGGSYTKLELEDWMIKSLEHEFTSAKDMCYNCSEKGHFAKECPLNKKLNIQKYLENFKNLEEIESAIDSLEKVYEQIIILNHQIKITNQFDMKKYNQRVIDIKELDGIILSLQQKLPEYEQASRTRNPNYIYRTNQTINDKRLELSKLFEEKTTLQHELNNINYNYIYKQLFVNDKIYLESEDNKIIKLYKLQSFNLEKKKELKDLLNIHTSEELITMKLEGLYEKKISILSN